MLCEEYMPALPRLREKCGEGALWEDRAAAVSAEDSLAAGARQAAFPAEVDLLVAFRAAASAEGAAAALPSEEALPVAAPVSAILPPA